MDQTKLVWLEQRVIRLEQEAVAARQMIDKLIDKLAAQGVMVREFERKWEVFESEKAEELRQEEAADEAYYNALEDHHRDSKDW